jgi:hypothetical protein
MQRRHGRDRVGVEVRVIVGEIPAPANMVNCQVRDLGDRHQPFIGGVPGWGGWEQEKGDEAGKGKHNQGHDELVVLLFVL